MKFDKIRAEWKRVKLLDRYLIVIMAVLMIYAVATIFSGTPTSSPEVAGGCDIVVRTTIASIFGYFISSNFAIREISFIPSNDKVDDNYNLSEQPKSKPSSERVPQNCLQIKIIGTLCLCTILVMAFTRFFSSADSKVLTTLSLFRDIICGSIGFLIGMPSDNGKQKE